MEKTCCNCYYWFNEKCVNTEGRHFNVNMTSDECCDSHTEAYVKPKEETVEAVNHPSHYNKGIEAIEVIESWELNFSLGNAIKYILRAPHKGKQLEDLQKASWYINREIERLAKNGK